jgi:hypothetical protein
VNYICAEECLFENVRREWDMKERERRLTETNVAGRKINVTTVMMRMTMASF